MTERETLLGQLTVLIKQIQDDFNQRASGAKEAPKGKNLPEVVNAIVWVRQLEARVSSLCINSCVSSFTLEFYDKTVHELIIKDAQFNRRI